MRVADVIARILADHGITTVFLVTGGGAMHLNDAMGREKRLAPVFNHHEQASAMAAESYFRLSGKLAAVNVTTGPGGLNALNGVFGAFTDSMGMVIVSGQVKRETSLRHCGLQGRLRQLGDQEVDIIPVVAPITKWCYFLDNPADVRWVMEKAIHMARSGRPGPVWVDVPIDVQSAQVDPEGLPGWSPDGDEAPPPSKADVLAVLGALDKAERPLMMVGSGVRIAGVRNELISLAERLGVPVVTAFNAIDVLPAAHPLHLGKPGTVGDRAGNFAVQNADFLLVLGCRLNIRQISYNWTSFAAKARVAMVDIDAAELTKPTLRVDRPIHADLRAFVPALNAASQNWQPHAAHAAWVNWGKERVKRYPVVLPEYRKTGNGALNPYAFMETLFASLADDDVVVTANATATICAFQSADIRGEQRLYSNSGSASMGWDLPAAIGACLARGRKRVVVLAGDGSIMMNLQELHTIAAMGLPIKIFLLENNGYHSIRQTQQAYFAESPIGYDPQSGLNFPDFSRLIPGFGLPLLSCRSFADAEGIVGATLNTEGPAACLVHLDPAQPFAPKLASRKLPDGSMMSPALDDMAPFLSREDLAANTISTEVGTSS